VFRQVEGVALVRGGKARAAAEQFIEFMRSNAVQQQMQTEMWMFPAQASVAKAEVMVHAPEPSAFSAPSEQDIATKGAAWVHRWTQVVLK
jgi:thiamine transport system substrate-binding protein